MKMKVLSLIERREVNMIEGYMTVKIYEVDINDRVYALNYKNVCRIREGDI